MFRFKYDAWHRLTRATKGYLNGSGTLTSGSAVSTMAYDALGRRTSRTVTNAADLSCTSHYYYDGQRVIETRNGSNQVLKQQVWGPSYVDHLVQVAVNHGSPRKGIRIIIENGLLKRPARKALVPSGLFPGRVGSDTIRSIITSRLFP